MICGIDGGIPDAVALGTGAVSHVSGASAEDEVCIVIPLAMVGAVAVAAMLVPVTCCENRAVGAPEVGATGAVPVGLAPVSDASDDESDATPEAAEEAAEFSDAAVVATAEFMDSEPLVTSVLGSAVGVAPTIAPELASEVPAPDETPAASVAALVGTVSAAVPVADACVGINEDS